MRRVTSKKHPYSLLSLILTIPEGKYLQSITVQVLSTALFSLPTKSSPDGPVAILPTPTYQLPGAKPLPKLKPLTNWKQFAAVKGYSKNRQGKTGMG